MLAPSAAASASWLRCPKAFDERLWRSGSSTIIKVPMTVRMISGRKRRASCGLKTKTGLAGTGDLRALRRWWALHPVGDVHVGLFQYAIGDSADTDQESLRVHAHPHHHDDEREDGRPFAGPEIPDVGADFGTGLAVEHALVHPEHVAGGEDDAERGPDGPGEVGDGGALQHQELADEIIQHRQADTGQSSDQESRG